MIKAERVLVSSSMSFSGVKLYSEAEQLDMGVPQILDGQIYLVDSLNKEYVFSNNFLSLIEWKKMRVPVDNVTKVKRINATFDQITYNPVYILKPEFHSKYDVPNLVGEPQLVFFSNGYIYICQEDNIPLIEL